MASELATAAIIAGYWQATAVIVGVVVLAVGAFSLVSLWAGRHIDAKFDKHAAATDAKFDAMEAKFDAKFDAIDAKFDAQAAVIEAHHLEVKEAIARGTKEHEDWRVEMRAVNEKVTELVIDREVERRMQASRGGTPAAGGRGPRGDD